jgi:hypothetical protein
MKGNTPNRENPCFLLVRAGAGRMRNHEKTKATDDTDSTDEELFCEIGVICRSNGARLHSLRGLRATSFS